MEYELVSKLISELGFPIAVCVALFWHNRETIKRFETAINKNTEVMGELINEIKRGS